MKSKQSIYQQIKNCPAIKDKMKKKALKELRAIQRSSTLRKECCYDKNHGEGSLPEIMAWNATPSKHEFWFKVNNRLFNYHSQKQHFN